MTYRVKETDFKALAAEVLDGLPNEFRKRMENVVVVVEDYPSDEDAADAGVDQVVFIQQGGNNQHAHICESLELFSREVMPHFKAGEAERERKKLARLAPALERAMARKNRMKELADSEIPPITPYGFAIAETSGGTALDEATRRRQERMREMSEAVRKAGN